MIAIPVWPLSWWQIGHQVFPRIGLTNKKSNKHDILSCDNFPLRIHLVVLNV